MEKRTELHGSQMKWHLEERNIEDLKEHPKNPRYLSKHNASHLKKSLDKFGLIDKPIITQENLVIGGHQRLNILKDSGVSNIECWVPDCELTEEEIDELNIRLNKNNGAWDLEKLANEWDAEMLVGCGFLPKDLFDDLEPKKKNPKVTIEFDSKEIMNDAMHEIDKIHARYQCKIKVKV